MNRYHLKTNLNCENCINAISPILNSLDNVEAWKVDLNSNDKIAELDLNNDNIDEVIHLIKNAGFKAELIS